MGVGVKEDEQKRPLYEIADDIKTNWPAMSPHAEPYWSVMRQLDRITDYYLADSAETIMRYFLVNATNWRGEDAKRIKAELKAMLK